MDIDELAKRSPFVQGLKDHQLLPHSMSKPLYKYTTVEAATQILSNLSFRFSSPVTFNDPFELHVGSLNLSTKFKYLRDGFFEYSRKNNPGISRKELDKAFKRLSLNEILEAQRYAYERQRREVSILCLSKSHKVTLMWSHYADKHRGVCIGIRLPHIIEDLNLVTMQVNYTTEINPPRFFSPDDFEMAYALLYWAFTKSKVWEYEEEVRAFITNRQLLRETNSEFLDVGFDPALFCEIYYGVATSQSDIEKLEEIIKKQSINIEKRSKMEINDGTFDLVEKAR